MSNWYWHSTLAVLVIFVIIAVVYAAMANWDAATYFMLFAIFHRMTFNEPQFWKDME